MRRIILLLPALLLLAGCTGYRQVSVGQVALGSLRFNGTSSATIVLEATVNNPTEHVIAIESADAVLLRDGREFVRLTLDGTSSAQPGTVSKVRIPVKASVLDPIAIITAGLDLRSWELDDYKVDGKIVLSADGSRKKTLKLNKVPLENIINSVR